MLQVISIYLKRQPGADPFFQGLLVNGWRYSHIVHRQAQVAGHGALGGVLAPGLLPKDQLAEIVISE